MLLAASDLSHMQLMTMVTAISAGVFLIVLARRLHIPAIVVLLAGGVLLGPSGPLTAWLGIELVDPESLGDGLRVIVAMAVGLILFEGGLTLDVEGYRSAPTMIRRLLTLGVLITWLGTTLAIWLIVNVPISQAVIGGSLVIVTGPTVIAPLLKRIRVNQRLHSVLHWEGVLIDPIGVFIAVLCFEFFGEAQGEAAFLNLVQRIGAGLVFGLFGGWLLALLVRRKMVPTEMINVFSLGMAMLIFGAAEAVRNEAGLLSVTIAGFVFGLSPSAKIKQVRQFKAELTDLLIGTLFILLAARLEFQQFQDFGLRGVAVVAVVMLLIRPLSVMLCSYRLDVSPRERLFLSWVAPRGIVAASMASLFAFRLADLGATDARFIETFTYSVIIATIVLQGFSAGPISRWLGVTRPDPRDWLIIGAHPFSRRLAQFISSAPGVAAILVDSNARAVRDARADGLYAFVADARDATALLDRPDFVEVGNVLALTDNEDLNVRLCRLWAEVVGEERVYRWSPPTAADVAREQDDDGEVGHVVWQALPRPTVLASELTRGDATIRDDGGRFSRVAMPLIVEENGEITLVGDDASMPESAEDGGRRLLAIKRKGDALSRALRPELVATFSADNLMALLTDGVTLLGKVVDALPREQMLSELYDREQMFPTIVAPGVAVPHGYSDIVPARLCAVIRIPEGVAYHESAPDPVRLAFLVLSPRDDSEGHLETLADIARRLMVPGAVDAIMDAADPAAVLRLLRRTR